MYKFVRPYKKPNRPRQTNKQQTTIFESIQNESDTKEKEKEEEESTKSDRQSRKTRQQEPHSSTENIKQTSHSIEKSNLSERRESFLKIKRNKSLDLKSDSSSAVTTFNERSGQTNALTKSIAY
jgi:hypothetical protein